MFAGFHIAMHNAVAVGVFQCRSSLPHDVERLGSLDLTA
jgi:hypothetical protein